MQALMCCRMSNCMQRKSILLGEANLASEQEVAPGSLKFGYRTTSPVYGTSSKTQKGKMELLFGIRCGWPYASFKSISWSLQYHCCYFHFMCRRIWLVVCHIICFALFPACYFHLICRRIRLLVCHIICFSIFPVCYFQVMCIRIWLVECYIICFALFPEIGRASCRERVLRLV